MTLCHYSGLRCKCKSGTTSPCVETFWIHVGLTTVDTCCLQQGGPVETQTPPRETNHLSLPLPEAGNGTMHRVRFCCSSFWMHTLTISLILLWCNCWDFTIVCYTGGYVFVFFCLLAFRHIEVGKFNTNPCLRFLCICEFYLPSECPQLSDIQFPMLYAKKSL